MCPRCVTPRLYRAGSVREGVSRLSGVALYPVEQGDELRVTCFGPGGATENSPAFQRWVNEAPPYSDFQAPPRGGRDHCDEANPTCFGALCRPAGAFGLKSLDAFPTPEGVGYCRLSLAGRDIRMAPELPPVPASCRVCQVRRRRTPAHHSLLADVGTVCRRSLRELVSPYKDERPRANLSISAMAVSRFCASVTPELLRGLKLWSPSVSQWTRIARDNL